MIRRHALLVVLAFAGFTAAATLGCGSGPPLDVASDVTLSRFLGKWYEVARLPRTTQTDCHGTTAFYTQAADGSLSFVNQCNVGSATGPLKTVSMTASVPDSHVPAKLALDVGGYVGDYWILEVGPNYEYAVVGHPSRLYLWILSRTPALDANTMQGILARAKSNQFDVSQLQYTPQPPAGERDALATPEGTIPPSLGTGCSMARGLAARERGGNGCAVALGLLVATMTLRARGRGHRPGGTPPQPLGSGREGLPHPALRSTGSLGA